MALLWGLACTPVATPVFEPPLAQPAPLIVWPNPQALKLLPNTPMAAHLLLDAGHGAEGNHGNHNWRCEAEEEVTRRISDAVALQLQARGISTTLTRPDDKKVAYSARLKQSASMDAMISLHSDSRAGTNIWQDPQGCMHNSGAQGFSVLWSDEGPPELVQRRQALAWALGKNLAAAGFIPYPGPDYSGLYAQDSIAGVFLDRHEARKRIMLLRRPTVPSVIIETHQAWDEAEAQAWEQPETHAAFAGAIAAALNEALIHTGN